MHIPSRPPHAAYQILISQGDGCGGFDLSICACIFASCLYICRIHRVKFVSTIARDTICRSPTTDTTISEFTTLKVAVSEKDWEGVKTFGWRNKGIILGVMLPAMVFPFSPHVVGKLLAEYNCCQSSTEENDPCFSFFESARN